MLTRRQFLQSGLVSSAALIAADQVLLASEAPNQSGWPIAIFEKVFEGLSYDELAEAIAEIDADGVEATIRPKGHIEPEAAADQVPKMSEALKKRGKRIIIAATGIGSVDQPDTEPLLRTLKTAGVTHYRLAHYDLDERKPLLAQVRNYAAQVKELASLNREIGIQGLYQNHAGARYLGALGWDAAYMLEGVDPDAVGIALDLRHLRTDTGLSWKTAASLLKPHIRSIYVKDAIWTGPRSDKLRDVPLDTGFVNDEVFEFVRGGLKPMPLSIHMEHLGYRVFEKHEIPAAIEAHQHDISALRRWLAG